MESPSTFEDPIRKWPEFPSTNWTVVLSASDRSSPQAQHALAELCAAYWYPLYAYARRHTGSRADAEDITQAFFARLIESNSIEGISREGGKFRSYLLTLLKHFIHNEWKKLHAEKRGGHKLFLSLNTDESEVRYRLEARDETSPDKLFERNWATALLESVLKRLEAEYGREQKGSLFSEIQPFLSGADRLIPYAVVAQRLGTSEQNVKVAVHRLRRRYGELLREEITRTVSDPAEIEAEIHALVAAATLGS